jgi:hypothetical protein
MDQAMGWTTRVQFFAGADFLSSSKCPNQCWDLPGLLSRCTGGGAAFLGKALMS